jgi:anthranilate synthase component 1
MDKDTLKKLSEGFPRVPVFKKLTGFDRPPEKVFLALKSRFNHCFILESAEESENGRYTFIGFDPEAMITVKNHVQTVRSSAGNIVTHTDDPKIAVKAMLEAVKTPKVSGLPPFTGGLVGYFAYDFIAYEEPTLPLLSDDNEFNDLDLMMFSKVIAFDHAADAMYIIININTDDFDKAYDNALEEAEVLAVIAANGKPSRPQKLKLLSEFVPDMNEKAFTGMVEKAKRHITEGDIFQIVLSNRFTANAEGSLYHTYTHLKRSNPSPYMLYFSGSDAEIAGSAPETLVSVRDGVVSTFPLAGTSRRGADEAEDRELERALLADEKERAEHNMLVDLGRNDVGKVSEIGSVAVRRYMDILRFSHVMHIGSEVTGTLQENLTAIDAVSAVLPAGTLSGAPKIRACEIIHDLEKSPRGIYGGALGYLASNGDADLCIAIRLAYKKNGKVYARSGAGIVADSVPEKEYTECANKLRAVTEGLRGAAK